MTFVGSAETGAKVAEACARRLVPLELELGGKSPNVVFADADLEKAVPRDRQVAAAERGPELLGGLAAAGRGDDLRGGASARVRDRVRRGQDRPGHRGPGPRAADLRAPAASARTRDARDGRATPARRVHRRRAPRRPVPAARARHRRARRTWRSSRRRSSARCSPRCRSRTSATRSQLANATAYGLVAGVWTQRPRPRAPRRRGHPRRAGVRQRLRGRRRGRAAVRRHGPLRLRAREGHRGAARLHARSRTCGSRWTGNRVQWRRSSPRSTSSQDELVALLQRLIRIPTVNPPGEATRSSSPTCARSSTATATPPRSTTRRTELAPLGEGLPRPNLIGKLAGDGPLVHLNGHYDVVPVGNDWTRDPFGGELARRPHLRPRRRGHEERPRRADHRRRGAAQARATRRTSTRAPSPTRRPSACATRAWAGSSSRACSKATR